MFGEIVTSISQTKEKENNNLSCSLFFFLGVEAKVLVINGLLKVYVRIQGVHVKWRSVYLIEVI